MKIYLVGGAIRNKFLGLPIKDKDWVVVGSNPRFFIKKKYKQVGKKFPVFLHPRTHEEYALARKEIKSGLGYKGFKVNYSPNVTLEEDLMRRDITINAIAKDKYGNYFDPYDGLKDIKNCILRHVSNSFSEDPLRIFRVARFAALLFHLGFKICKETLFLMSSSFLKNEIKYLEKERIWEETKKAFKTKHPNIYFKVLFKCNVIIYAFPEIYYLFNLNEKLYYFNKQYFLNQNIFLGLAYISKYTNKIDMRISFFLQLFSLNFVNCVSNKKKKLFLKFFFNFVKKFFFRINVPNKIKNLSIVFVKNINFLIDIHYKSSEEIIFLFKRINAWRNSEIVYKLSFLTDCYINFLNIFYKKHFYKNVFVGNYLKNVFKVAQSISFKNVSKKINKGIQIQKEINKLRKSAIDKWKCSIFNKKI
ncbi:tRNA CCA-pyrophosphorylase [Buchnera aphidicola (Astegopteryx bambusae)]|uniref:tRNA CCA-pyrophosphorylase n=1 Tax=Buchnera aphidicola TaxID=9 RepID=UPI0031B88046